MPYAASAKTDLLSNALIDQHTRKAISFLQRSLIIIILIQDFSPFYPISEALWDSDCKNIYINVIYLLLLSTLNIVPVHHFCQVRSLSFLFIRSFPLYWEANQTRSSWSRERFLRQYGHKKFLSDTCSCCSKHSLQNLWPQIVSIWHDCSKQIGHIGFDKSVTSSFCFSVWSIRPPRLGVGVGGSVLFFACSDSFFACLNLFLILLSASVAYHFDILNATSTWVVSQNGKIMLSLFT